jgi:hypothetical protein
MDMKDEVCNTIEAKVCFHFSVLIVVTDDQMSRLVQLWLTSHCEKQF